MEMQQLLSADGELALSTNDCALLIVGLDRAGPLINGEVTSAQLELGQ